jgi:oligopeptide transport system permease protein
MTESNAESNALLQTEAAARAGIMISGTPPGPQGETPRSLSGDAWRSMRRRPMFWIATSLITAFVLMAIVPGLFTHTDPRDTFDVRLRPGAGGHLFGTDGQGYDIYSRTVHGARASILVGLLTTLVVALLGSVVGVIAAYFGGWLDALLSRIADVFFAIPLVLGGILFLTAFPSDQNTPYFEVVMKVVLALAVLGWPSAMRLMRASVLQVKPNEYVLAARALGASTLRIIVAHIVPNALGPIIAFSTISLGVYIVTEATLSFLGIGLVPPAVSWGVAIDEALPFVRSFPHMLVFPSLALSLCVFAFIMLGDVVSDAFDPKSANR